MDYWQKLSILKNGAEARIPQSQSQHVLARAESCRFVRIFGRFDSASCHLIPVGAGELVSFWLAKFSW